MHETRDYHVNILTKLGQCYLEGGQLKEALDLLNKSLQFSETLQGKDSPNSCHIYILLAKLYLK